MFQRTLSILKPDAVKAKIVGEVISYIQHGGLDIYAIKSTYLTWEQAASFYSIHKEMPFYKDLVRFMTSGMIVVQVLEGDNAIAKYRDIMGDTDPKKAKKGTIRADFAKSIDENCVHGSDSVENATKEIQFFFSEISLFKPTKHTDFGS